MPLSSYVELTESPGSTVGACTKEDSFASIAKAINQAHKEVPEVITVIENMVLHPSIYAS
jgi:endonuclease IV